MPALTNTISLCLILGLLSSPSYVFGSGWSYDDMGNWSEHFPDCGGTLQSPVDITYAETDSSLGQLNLINFDNVTGVSWTLANNGHSAQVTYDSGDLRVSGGGLPGEYKVAQFHFHWGSNASVGSEHTFNGVQFPMEMHVVMYKTAYGSFQDALDHSDGLAVLGVFFQETSAGDEQFEPLLNSLTSVKNAGSSTSVSPIPLANLMPNVNGNTYYRYKGSLTTPPCLQVVIWTVFPELPLSISKGQLQQFRALLDSNGANLVNNFRPTQPLNNRPIGSSA